MTVGTLDWHLLLPASEALIDDASIKRFRGRYRELFGAAATQDPLYEAISDGRRMAGMEHWLPLFEDRSEEHTSELQSLMRISYAVFCLKKKNTQQYTHNNHIHI